MYSEIDKNIILKFIERNYPVKRIKHNMRFKRAILFDDGFVCFLSDKSAEHQVRLKLIGIISKTLAYDAIFVRTVLSNFSSIK